MGMLQLDLLYVRLNDAGGKAPIEMARVAHSEKQTTTPGQIGTLLNQWPGDAPEKWPPRGRMRFDGEDMSVLSLRLGLEGEFGLVVAGSRRVDFPAQAETLLLTIAANLTTIGLREARLRSELIRGADELDHRVAQRTSELAAANEELKKEIAERRLAEVRLRQEEVELRRSEARKAAILDSALDCIVTIDHEGSITEFNPAAERTFGYRRDEVVGRSLADVIIPPSLPGGPPAGLGALPGDG